MKQLVVLCLYIVFVCTNTSAQRHLQPVYDFAMMEVYNLDTTRYGTFCIQRNDVSLTMWCSDNDGRERMLLPQLSAPEGSAVYLIEANKGFVIVSVGRSVFLWQTGTKVWQSVDERPIEFRGFYSMITITPDNIFMTQEGELIFMVILR
jgi:hypothetical protein